MSKYLVTGGAGFIGSNIVEELAARGMDTRVIDNLSTGKEENLAPFMEKIDFQKMMIEKCIDFVIKNIHQLLVVLLNYYHILLKIINLIE